MKKRIDFAAKWQAAWMWLTKRRGRQQPQSFSVSISCDLLEVLLFWTHLCDENMWLVIFWIFFMNPLGHTVICWALNIFMTATLNIFSLVLCNDSYHRRIPFNSHLPVPQEMVKGLRNRDGWEELACSPQGAGRDPWRSANVLLQQEKKNSCL